MKHMQWTIPLLSLFFVAGVVAQPATCAPLVEVALAALDENCAEVSRNNACYGHDNVVASFTGDGFPADFFSNPSDIASLTSLTSLRTAPFSDYAETWGVALMSVQANLPATLPGQNVIFVIMGDAAVAPAEGDNPDSTPMSAFYFTTGIGHPNCNESPDTLIIQSPGEASVQLNINGADVTLASTAALSIFEVNGQPAMELTMLDGEATLNDEIVVPEGFWILIPLDADNPVDETFYAISPDAETFCRRTPDADRSNFLGLVGGLSGNILAEPVSEITTDPRGCGLLHIVAGGENLFRISQQYGVTVDDIVAANNLPDRAQIAVGEVLHIPLPDVAPPESTE